MNSLKNWLPNAWLALLLLCSFLGGTALANIGDRWAVQTDDTNPRVPIWRVTRAGTSYGARGPLNVTNGEFCPGADNTYDIGDATHRVRSLFISNTFGPPTSVNASANYAANSGIVVLTGLTGATTVNITKAPSAGAVLKFVDGDGSTASHTVTISPGANITINGSSSYSLATAYKHLELVGVNATAWSAY